LSAGVHEVVCPKGLKINQVKLKGMRNKPVMLLRVPREDIAQISTSTRAAFPKRYAIEYRRHVQSVAVLLIDPDSDAVLPYAFQLRPIHKSLFSN
jgi:hypothetical protein